MVTNTKARSFSLGLLFQTPGAKEEIGYSEIQLALIRHRSGDWGDCTKDDWQANEDALEHEGRIFSVYHDHQGRTFWVITEADRSYTTVLLPSEY